MDVVSVRIAVFSAKMAKVSVLSHEVGPDMGLGLKYFRTAQTGTISFEIGDAYVTLFKISRRNA